MVVGLVVANGCGSAKEKAEEARTLACKANMRVLQGSIEMYNMDNVKMIDALTPEHLGETGLLVKKNYLRKPLKKPDPKCEYKSRGDLSDKGEIYCVFHGSVAEINKKKFKHFKNR